MPRRREVPKREILPDPKFGSVEISKFINVIMLDGKKAVAERIVYGALQQIEEKTNTHVDFMIGTSDLSIIGTTKDGREVPVFVNGSFAL